MLEFIDSAGVWVLRALTVAAILALAFWILYVLFVVTLFVADRFKHRHITRPDPGDRQRVKTLLYQYLDASREVRAKAFCNAGIRFIPGPFRNQFNFTPEELQLLPTNEELYEAGRAERGSE